MDFSLFWSLSGLVGAAITAKKGRRGCGWLILILFLGPFGLILALIVPKKRRSYTDNAPDNATFESDE